jgi:hypothetical protein
MLGWSYSESVNQALSDMDTVTAADRGSRIDLSVAVQFVPVGGATNAGRSWAGPRL